MPEGALIGIDEGGLCLVAPATPEVYIEVGGIPEEIEASMYLARLQNLKEGLTAALDVSARKQKRTKR